MEAPLSGLWLIAMAQILDAPTEGTTVASVVFDVADDDAFEDPIEQ